MGVYSEIAKGRRVINGGIIYFADFFEKDERFTVSDSVKKFVEECRKKSPEEFSDLEPLAELYDLAPTLSDKIFTKIGNWWGAAMKSEWDKLGLTGPLEITKKFSEYYINDHQMKDGSPIPDDEIVVEGEEGGNSLIVRFRGCHPPTFLVEAYRESASVTSGKKITVEYIGVKPDELTEDDVRNGVTCRFSW